MWERRASERACARSTLTPTRRGSAFGTVLTLATATLGALGACRQTVVLDPSDRASGDATGTGGAGPVIDARNDSGGGGGAGSSHFDGGRVDGIGICFGGQIQFVPNMLRVPDIILSVDRSASMQSWFGSGSRLDVIHQQVRALISKYKRVRFGYEEFPAAVSMCSNGQGCCAGDVAQPITDNLKAIDRIISGCDNGGPGCDQPQRPVADALAKCNSTYAALFSAGDPGHRYVLLLTSGDPTCGTGPDSTSSSCDDAQTQVTKLSRANINTGVFGIGDGAVGSACLDQLATYGGIDTGSTPLYHLARTPTELSGALEAVVETIAEEACKIDLRSAPPDPNVVELRFDGMRVPQDGVDGWTFDQDGSLTLTVHGSYCHALIQNTQQVTLVTGCR
ncbi:MAG TPA: vWA domain-containing protein [Polyangia bacterium]